MLAEIPVIAEIHLEANNRTWDTIAERGDELGVYTEARPPYGVLGVRLKRLRLEEIRWLGFPRTCSILRAASRLKGVKIDLHFRGSRRRVRSDQY